MKMNLKVYSGSVLYDPDDHRYLYRRTLTPYHLTLLKMIKDLPGLINFEDISSDKRLVRMERLPAEIRAQDLTKKQVKRLLLGLVDFCIDCLGRGACPYDISESNVLYWNKKAYFVDLDAFCGPTARGRGFACSYVKLSYLINRYLRGNQLIPSASVASHVTIKQYKDWTSENWGRNTTDVKLWREYKEYIKSLSISDKKTHWSEEYARDLKKVSENQKFKKVILMLEPAYGGSILDVGTNKGYYLNALKDKYSLLVGFDNDEHCVDLAESQFGDEKAAFVNFGIKDCFVGTRVTDSRIGRFKSDTVLALAVTHHFKTNNIDPRKAARALVDLSNKWILLEDIEHRRIYSDTFSNSGFRLVNRIKSYPESRGLSLWERP